MGQGDSAALFVREYSADAGILAPVNTENFSSYIFACVIPTRSWRSP